MVLADRGHPNTWTCLDLRAHNIPEMVGRRGERMECDCAPLLVPNLQFSIICLQMDVEAFQRPRASLNDGISARALPTEPPVIMEMF